MFIKPLIFALAAFASADSKAFPVVVPHVTVTPRVSIPARPITIPKTIIPSPPKPPRASSSFSHEVPSAPPMQPIHVHPWWMFWSHPHDDCKEQEDCKK